MKLGQRCFYKCNECGKIEEGFDHEIPVRWMPVTTREWSPYSDSNIHICTECDEARRKEEEET